MQLTINKERWPLAKVFRLSRREATTTDVLVVELGEEGARGRGEAGPIARYGETVASCARQIEAARPAIEAGIGHDALQLLLPAGAARNAVDCALWDLRAKQAGQRVWDLLEIDAPAPLRTAYTLSVDTPEKVLHAAEVVADRPVLKIKLAGDEHDLTRVRAVRAAAPHAQLIVDANEALSLGALEAMLPVLVQLQVALVEQPLPEGADKGLERLDSPIPLCADESCHGIDDLERLHGRYDVVNIKLDKTGGLTGALALRQAAIDAGFDVMVGCMLGTSLAMAPAMLVGQRAGFVDLDGPLLLARDREAGLRYADGLVYPPDASLWG